MIELWRGMAIASLLFNAGLLILLRVVHDVNKGLGNKVAELLRENDILRRGA